MALFSRLIACTGIATITFGLGTYLVRNTDSPRTAVEAAPLFARSVEQAELSGSRWPSKRLDVPYYGPMVELLTYGASASRVTPDDQQPRRAVDADVQRAATGDGRPPRRMQRSTRTKTAQSKDRAQSTKVDPRDAYARGDPLPQPRGSSHAAQGSEPKAQTREENRERRAAPAPEGFTPFRMFGIFESR